MLGSVGRHARGAARSQWSRWAGRQGAPLYETVEPGRISLPWDALSEPATHDQTARSEGRGRNWRRVRWAKVKLRLDRMRAMQRADRAGRGTADDAGGAVSPVSGGSARRQAVVADPIAIVKSHRDRRKATKRRELASANSSAFFVFAHQREVAEACQGVCSTELLSTIF